jgi:hypothetical protein
MAQLAPDDVPRLKLKWAFGYPGAVRAFAQPWSGSGSARFLLSASHSMEPIAHLVWVGCGLTRGSAASAFPAVQLKYTFAFHRLDQQFAERPYQGINAVR